MRIISVVLLFLTLIAERADAISDKNKERLAEMFSPILILTEETRNIYDDETVPIRVIKPEPVEIVGAVGGLIRIFARPSKVATVKRWEYMTHTGLVLSTQAPPNNSDLWESYDLVLLPEGLPDPNYDNNMGLTPDMSWLGAQIQWGTIAEIFGGHESPAHGPYNSKADCFSLETIPPNCGWGELKFDEVGEIVGDPFSHKELPDDSYHHWAIIGNETWSDTISLSGDVVVFPSATLTPVDPSISTYVASSSLAVSFGSLPLGVVAVGTTRQATVRLLDEDADPKPVFFLSGGAKEAIVGQSFSFTRPSASVQA
jgi:hypothetical protein